MRISADILTDLISAELSALAAAVTQIFPSVRDSGLHAPQPVSCSKYPSASPGTSV